MSKIEILILEKRKFENYLYWKRLNLKYSLKHITSLNKNFCSYKSELRISFQQLHYKSMFITNEYIVKNQKFV